nr:hypothetical protein [Tanacetum cinerariifolium]
MSWFLRCSWCGGPFNSGNCRRCANVSFEDEPVYDSNLNSYNQTPDFSNPLPHHNYETDSRSDPGAAFQEKTILLRDIISQLPPSIVITTSPHVLPIEDLEDSLIMGNEELSTIPKKESDEVIKSSVEDFVPIPSESEDTFESDSECDDFSPINIPEGKFVTFSNPLFGSSDDFTSSDDESLSNDDVPEDNVKIYSNPLFEFDDEYISSGGNPIFNEVSEDIKSKYSYDSNLNEPALLVTPLFDSNEDECFDPGDDVDEINAFDIPLYFEDGYFDSKGDVLYLESFLSDDTTPNLPPKVFLDRDPRSLSDINDLKDCPDYEDSRARGFCPSFTRASILSMLIYGNPIS